MNELFTEAVNYRKSHPITKSTRYDNGVENKRTKMTRKTAMQMKVLVFNGKDPVSIIAFQ